MRSTHGAPFWHGKLRHSLISGKRICLRNYQIIMKEITWPAPLYSFFVFILSPIRPPLFPSFSPPVNPLLISEFQNKIILKRQHFGSSKPMNSHFLMSCAVVERWHEFFRTQIVWKFKFHFNICLPQTWNHKRMHSKHTNQKIKDGHIIWIYYEKY